MANYDNKAFDSMVGATKSKTGPLFKEGTESQYNSQSTKEEQGAFDRKAFKYIANMYRDDKDAGLFQDLNMEQYMNTITGTYFHERVNLPRKDDPGYYEQAGDMFFNIYEGDFDQFIGSAQGGFESSPKGEKNYSPAMKKHLKGVKEKKNESKY